MRSGGVKDADAAQLEKHNLQYDTGLTLPPGKYSLRFLARENQTGKMGTFETKFTIPDLSLEKALRLSSVIYSTTGSRLPRQWARRPTTRRAAGQRSADSGRPEDWSPASPACSARIRTCTSTSKSTIPARIDQKISERRRRKWICARRTEGYSSQPVEVKKLIAARPGVARSCSRSRWRRFPPDSTPPR